MTIIGWHDAVDDLLLIGYEDFFLWVSAYDPGQVTGLVEPRNPRNQWQRCEHFNLGMHTCPFKTEIHEDDTPCICCDDCAHECAMDI